MTKKGFLEIYALAVCFFTLVCFVVTLGLAVWDLVEISVPEFTIRNNDYECHISDDAYTDCYSNQSKYTRENNPISFPEGQELTNKRKSEYAQLLRFEQREAVQGLVQKSIIMLIDLIVFIFHWRLSVRVRREDS